MGTPFFHSMVARAQASASDISVLIDPEDALLPDFITILSHALKKLQHNWLLVASPWKVPYFPFDLDKTRADLVGTDEPNYTENGPTLTVAGVFCAKPAVG